MSGPARTVFLGSGGFAVPILHAVASAPELSLVGVVTAPARPAGRSGSPRPTPIALAAMGLGVPILTPARLRDPEAWARIAALAPDLLVLADYGRIVPQALLDLPPHGALNLHPSLLPRHRGATPIPAAILAGDTETGVSLMRMDAGIDTGPIVAQARQQLQGTETTPELEPVLADLAAALLRDHVGAWLAGDVPGRPQPTEGASLTRPSTRADGELDGGRPAAELERRVRALQPWPGTWLALPDGRLIVRRAVVRTAPEGEGPTRAPGWLVPADPGVLLTTPDGALELLEVQPADGRPMPGDAWRRGRRDLPLRVPGTPIHPPKP